MHVWRCIGQVGEHLVQRRCLLFFFFLLLIPVWMAGTHRRVDCHYATDIDLHAGIEIHPGDDHIDQ